MKKILTLVGAALVLVLVFRAIPPVKTSAETVTFPMCGGIQGLACADGSFCDYGNGSKVAPHPDASGVCKPNAFECAKSAANGTTCKLCSSSSASGSCDVVNGACQNGVCTPIPTATPTNTPTPTPIPAWNIAPVTAGTADLCSSLVISDTNIGPGDTIIATAKSTSSDIVSFGWWFYNMDNLNANNAPKPIKFVSASDTEVMGVIHNKQIATNQSGLTINFYDVNRRDLNWSYYMPKPKRIRVDAYFKKAGATAWSKYDANCSRVFNAQTVDPTPTPVASCACAAATNNCATTCFFDKFGAGVTYDSPIKCNLGAGLFSSAPTAADKNGWCHAYLRTKGDANADGKVSILDYFYYVSATIFGAKLPPNVNIDFNGDGVVSSADKAVLMKSLKP